MRVFWRHGYEGASMTLLTEAMAINTPSLYAAFGNKEELFRQSLDRYVQTQATYVRKALAQPTARGVAEAAFRGAIKLAMKPDNPSGCMFVRGALVCSPECERVRSELSGRRRMLERIITKRFVLAQKAGDLPRSEKPAQLARFLVTMLWGLSVQAAGGATRTQLKDAAAIALRAWPV